MRMRTAMTETMLRTMKGLKAKRKTETGMERKRTHEYLARMREQTKSTE